MKTVSITKTKRSKKGGIDWEFVEDIRKSLEDIKHGRVIEWRPRVK